MFSPVSLLGGMLLLMGCQKDITSFECGAHIEYSDNMYRTVLIGDRCWMRDNMNTGTRIKGSENALPANSSIEKYCHGNLDANCDQYGGLYQWAEAMQDDYGEKSRGICPEGWHIPSDAEWSMLIESLGDFAISGYQLKSVTGWYLNGNGNDSSGFSALPGGDRDYDGTFMNLTRSTAFWTSTKEGQEYAFCRVLGFHFQNVYRNYYNRSSGFAVRCIKNL